MNISFGTKLFLIIFLGALLLLVMFLLLFSLLGKKKGKFPGGGKFLTILFAIITIAFSVMTPLAHYNVIDINLKYGWYSHKDENGTMIKITRNSIEYHSHSSASDKKGTYVLESDTLTITWDNGAKEEYEIKDFGKKLYKGETKIYSYLKNQGGLE